jgi:hypothetical protein
MAAASNLGGQELVGTNIGNKNEKNRVFISYAREDSDAAKRLEDLKKAGLNPWLDKENILPGQNIEISIKDAIKKSRYFIALLSSNSIEKIGYVQKDLKKVDVLGEFPELSIYLIPARLDNCDTSYQQLREINHVDLFHNREGVTRILNAIRHRP